MRPVIKDNVYGYKRLNVADQRRDPQSLLNWTERMIRARKECPEISWGDFVVLRTNAPQVLALRFDWRNTSLVTLHNFSSGKHTVKVKIDSPRDGLVEVFDGHHSKAQNDGAHRIILDGCGWRWFRVGAPDNALDRSDLDPTVPAHYQVVANVAAIIGVAVLMPHADVVRERAASLGAKA